MTWPMEKLLSEMVNSDEAIKLMYAPIVQLANVLVQNPDPNLTVSMRDVGMALIFFAGQYAYFSVEALTGKPWSEETKQEIIQLFTKVLDTAPRDPRMKSFAHN